MTATLTQPTRHSDSERERLRRRRDRHARLATECALTEVAFALRARQRRDRGQDSRRSEAGGGRKRRLKDASNDWHGRPVSIASTDRPVQMVPEPRRSDEAA